MRIPYRVRNLLRKSYTGSTLLQHAQYYVDPVYRRNPLIVYQMGKVGSEALEASLLECGIERPIYRVHAMVRDNIVRGFRGIAPLCNGGTRNARAAIVAAGPKVVRQLAVGARVEPVSRGGNGVETVPVGHLGNRCNHEIGR